MLKVSGDLSRRWNDGVSETTRHEIWQDFVRRNRQTIDSLPLAGSILPDLGAFEDFLVYGHSRDGGASLAELSEADFRLICLLADDILPDNRDQWQLTVEERRRGR